MDLAVRYQDENQSVALISLSDTDLAAIGGASTNVLALVAVGQMRHSSRQTEALEGQVQAVRDAAAAELDALKGQIEASIAQGEAVREAARAQLQPIVFAHAYSGALKGPDAGADLGPGEVGFRYCLANEGMGVALNIRHGIAIDTFEREFGDGMEVRSLRPGERLPQPSTLTPLAITVAAPETDLPSNWSSRPRTYWTRFENVFGDEFETRNPHDPLLPATFRRVRSNTVSA
jgi:hypothetical protein